MNRPILEAPNQGQKDNQHKFSYIHGSFFGVCYRWFEKMRKFADEFEDRCQVLFHRVDRSPCLGSIVLCYIV